MNLAPFLLNKEGWWRFETLSRLDPSINGILLKKITNIFALKFLVPSRAPYLSRVRSVAFSSDLMVYWYPISPNYVNGRLLGYSIYYRYRQSYYSWSSHESVNTSSHNATYLKLTNLKPGQQYRVSVAAFTSKGVGARSYEYSAMTGEDSGENKV